MSTDTAPAYFGDAARAAWDEITAGLDSLHGTGDRLRCEQAALLLAELRAAPELFNASKHAQLRALLAELLPPTPQPPADEPGIDFAGLNRALARGVTRQREERRGQREARKQAKGG